MLFSASFYEKERDGYGQEEKLFPLSPINILHTSLIQLSLPTYLPDTTSEA